MELIQIDPVGRQTERGFEQAGLSPMDPPDAYAPPALDAAPVEDRHPMLRRFSMEHERLAEAVEAVDEAISAARGDGYGAATDRALCRFLEVFDREFVPHSLREERLLFPLLRERLMASGEHGTGPDPLTGVDVMAREHLHANQSAAVMAGLLGVARRLSDERSAEIVLDAALRAAADLVELLRLHMFREDHVLFASAHRLIDAGELDAVERTTGEAGEVGGDGKQGHGRVA